MTKVRASLSHAVIAALLTLMLSAPILGVHLEQSANGLSISGSWLHSVYAAIAVFIVQLLLPLLRQSCDIIRPIIWKGTATKCCWF